MVLHKASRRGLAPNGSRPNSARGFASDTAAKFSIHDNDAIIDEAVSGMLRVPGIPEIETSPGAP